jgi:opacity protein-like surface antigen
MAQQFSRFTTVGIVSFLVFYVFSADISAKDTEFEITPLVGYRFGGDFYARVEEQDRKIKLAEEVSYGGIFAWSLDKDKQGEVLISHYSSNFTELSSLPTPANKDTMSITYAHLGGNVRVSEGSMPIYVLGGFGLTHLSPDDAVFDAETRFSMNLGLGAKAALTENLSLTMNGRVFATFFDSDRNVFCADGACLISIDSDLWLQTEVNVGLAFKF